MKGTLIQMLLYLPGSFKRRSPKGREGRALRYWGIHKRNRKYVYRAKMKDCAVCPRKAECTRDRARSVSYHIHEDSIQRARQLNQTRAYRISQRMRKRIEELFGERKEWMGLRRAKIRRWEYVGEQVLMTATAQNIKRMVKLLSPQETEDGGPLGPRTPDTLPDEPGVRFSHVGIPEHSDNSICQETFCGKLVFQQPVSS
jgi:hypothetical protein